MNKKKIIFPKSISLDVKYSTTRIVFFRNQYLKFNSSGNEHNKMFLPKNINRVGEGGLRTMGYFKSSLPGNPLISIITIVYNGEKYLENTIQSVINQTYNNIEYIVIDGGSSDNSINIIRKYNDYIDYWISEPDNGISDAFNKGISISTGIFHAIINSDDWYKLYAINSLIGLCSPGISVVCANSIVVDDNGRFYRKYISKPSKIKYKMSIAHNSCLINTEMWRDIGGYGVHKKIAMDHHLLLRLYLKYGRQSFRYLNIDVSYYRSGGISDKEVLNGFREVRDNISELLYPTFKANFYYWLLISKYLGDKILRPLINTLNRNG